MGFTISITACFQPVSCSYPALYEQAKCKPGFVASPEEHAVKLLQRLGYSVLKLPESAQALVATFSFLSSPPIKIISREIIRRPVVA